MTQPNHDRRMPPALTPQDLEALPPAAAWHLEMYRLILDNIHNGIIVTDPQGYVTHFNAPYGRFLNLDPAQQIGRHTTEVVENSRMHLVAQSGQPEINHAHHIRGQEMVVQRIPIFREGRVIAVFGQVMFKNVSDVGALASQLKDLKRKVRLYQEEISSLRAARYTLESIIGPSPALEALKAEARQAAKNRLPVLITGESGTGKELFAQAIHHASPRRAQPLVRINCSTIPAELFESELFGYDKGAFTGARNEGKPGKIELAHGGTLFLDEIGELPLALQPKLLRVLEEKEFERVGGTKVRSSDFRLIAATNQDLDQMMAQGRFRKDLFYRLNVIGLHLPPLRARVEDIPPLVEHLLAQIAPPPSHPRFTAEAMHVLTTYHWPGNVRELANALERVVASLEGDTIQRSDLPFHLQNPPRPDRQNQPWDLRHALARAEREALRHALALCQGNKSQAAQMLGIHRTLLYKKMARHGLKDPA
jgi:transcriptional regulator with PAS, ATPase and Fis domain